MFTVDNVHFKQFDSQGNNSVANLLNVDEIYVPVINSEQRLDATWVFIWRN